MASIRTVSKRAGVSVATVSRVLNNFAHVDPRTRQKVLAAVESSGYVRAVARRSTTMIGLAYACDVVRPDYGGFDAAVLSGVMHACTETKLDLSIVSIRRDKLPDESYAQFFERKGLRGVALRVTNETRHVAEAIAAEGFPSIVIADRFESPSVQYICCDSRPDTERATEHLIALGHRRIAIGVHRIPDTDHLDRRQGYETALRAHRIPIDRSLSVEIMADMDGGAALITGLLSLPDPPTALLLTDPFSSLGAMRRCFEIGLRIPSEFSLVGFDDSNVRALTFPRMTSVVQDAHMLGLEAARALASRLSGAPGTLLRRVLSTRLEINGTTSAPPDRPVRILPDGSRTQPGGKRPARTAHGPDDMHSSGRKETRS